MRHRIIKNISDISSKEWNECSSSAPSQLNPFCSHGFLSALEESGCVTAETGWLPQHVILEDDSNILAAMPLYLKNHSMGEYVFDHAWANAYTQAGGRYYPKLQCSIPFSPVTGPRLMARDSETKSRLLEAAISHAEQCGVSSLHITFPESNELDVMTSHDLLPRMDQQYHWHNENYKSFDDFLSVLSSRKRKNIQKERRAATNDADISIEIIKSDEITEYHWDHYFEFYMDTAHRKWGRPYLNRLFFSLLSENISENILLIMAKRNGKYIAGALNLIGPDALYGRYWGAIEHHNCLHFELCYYQAIEYAINNNISRVEAGAQGEHKIARGYIPIPTHSAHWIANPVFKDAIKKYLAQEREAVGRDIDLILRHGPFKNLVGN